MDIKSALKQAYDTDAQRRNTKNYEENREDWKDDARNQFSELAKQEGKTTVLELGAGSGIDSKYFKDNGFEVTAIDLSPEMVKMIQARGVNALELDLYDLKSLEGTFDGIYSLNVLLHVPRRDLENVLDIIADKLNDNGIFFFGVYGGLI